MRVQRTTPGNAICVLLRHDGQFHLETAQGDRTKVLEGSLPSSELLKVQRMLYNDGLPGLSQETPEIASRRRKLNSKNGLDLSSAGVSACGTYLLLPMDPVHRNVRFLLHDLGIAAHAVSARLTLVT